MSVPERAHWVFGGSGRLSDHTHDEEVSVVGRTVVWTAGACVRKKFTVSSDVVQVVWCYFPESAIGLPKPTKTTPETKNTVCILQQGCVEIFSPSGAVYSVVLPCRVAGVWSLPVGLLLQRAVGPGESADLPVLYSLLHPLEEIKPVSLYREEDASSIVEEKEGTFADEFVCDPTIKVLLTSADPPIMVACSDGKHSVWIFRRAWKRKRGTFDEMDPSIDLTEDAEIAAAFLGDQSLVSEHQDYGDLDSDVQLELLWEDAGGTSAQLSSEAGNPFFRTPLRGGKSAMNEMVCASKVFLAEDDVGKLLLCFHVGGSTLHALAFESSCIEHAFSLKCKDAAPIFATRRPRLEGSWHCKDLLVVEPDGTLAVYVGSMRLCDVAAPMSSTIAVTPKGPVRSQPSTPISTPASDTSDDVILLSPAPEFKTPAPAERKRGRVAAPTLRDEVGDRVTILFPEGRSVRCQVSFLCSNPLVTACFGVIQAVMPRAMVHTMKKDYIALSSAEPDLDDWQRFVTLIDVLLDDKPSVAAGKKDDVDDWDWLMHSTYHHDHYLEVPGAMDAPPPQPASTQGTGNVVVSTSRESFKDKLTTLMDAMHLLYEDFKLNVLTGDLHHEFARFLSRLCARLGRWGHVDHYGRDFGDLATQEEVPSQGAGHVPCVYAWLDACLSRQPVEPFPTIASPFDWCDVGRTTRMICSLYSALLMTEEVSAADVSVVLDQSFASASGREAFSSPYYTRQLDSYALQTRRTPTVSVSLNASGIASPMRHPVFTSPQVKRIPLGGNDESTLGNHIEQVVLTMSKEGLDLDSLPFGVALPLRAAVRACRAHPPANWPVEAYVLVGRRDLAAQKDPEFLSKRRPLPTKVTSDPEHAATVAAAGDGTVDERLGRTRTSELASMRFCNDLRVREVERMLDSSQPVVLKLDGANPGMNDHDLVQEQQTRLLHLAQRTMAMPVGRGMLTLASLRPLLSEPLPIPPLNFSGRVENNALVALDVDAHASTLTEWGEFHNGVAAGLRVSPDQTDITSTWIVYNRPEELTYGHAGLLMGLGLHGLLSNLHVVNLYNYLGQGHEITSLAILIGMSAAKRGTMDSSIAKMLSIHIPSLLPLHPSSGDLEVHPLVQIAALFSLGLLYQGSAHRRITEVLLAEIGRQPSSDVASDRECYALAAGLALGLVTLGRGSSALGLADLKIEDTLRSFMVGGRSEAAKKKSKQKDGRDVPNNVNIDVTAPGATLALGMMFLKTNDEAVAARLSVPDTKFLLDYVRPDFLLSRVIARSLVMWDSIEATEEWMLAQMPEFMRARGDPLVPRDDSEDDPTLDVASLNQAYCNVLAGSCFALGLSFAGSALARACELLKKRVAHLEALQANAARLYLDKSTVETCLDTVVIALCMVMAGTGNLEVLRIVRRLRSRAKTSPPESGSVHPSITYGSHMAIGMGIGLLFLGGGALTLGTSNGAVAALVCAFYPRFPVESTDNRYHLQALRHLYVLATEARCIEARDVDSLLPCYVPVEITTAPTAHFAATSYGAVAPCLIPEKKMIKSITVASPRYWSTTVNMGEQKCEEGHHVIYVKKKTGFLSYQQDPTSERGILSRPFPKSSADTVGDKRKNEEFIRAFSGDPNILAFAHHFCGGDDTGNPEFTDFCTGVLYECLSREKSELLPTYVAIYTAVEGLERRQDIKALWNIRLVQSSCSACVDILQGSSSEDEELIQSAFLDALRCRVESFFRERVSPADIATYLKTFAFPKEAPQMFAAFLVCHGVPAHSSLVQARVWLNKLDKAKRGSERTRQLLLASILPGVPPGTLMSFAAGML